jgi:uncharacterized protein (TIGR03437 family)
LDRPTPDEVCRDQAAFHPTKTVVASQERALIRAAVFDLPGLFPISVALPTTATKGNGVPVKVTIGGASSQYGVKLAVR